ncbi:MAG: Flp pilus assembly complex ATPase component TadA [Elusimicrobia bacterium]|nr:Flp pilus assembly complex ATPase component TadA [Elusimicrobiota bacterium]
METAKIDLGMLLLQNRIVTEEQLRYAMQLQQTQGKPLGDVLVELKYINDVTLAVALSQQFQIPYASRDNKILRKRWYQGMETTLTEDFSRKNLILPLYVEGQIMTVAVADPSNLMLIDSVRMMTGYEIRPVIAARTELLRAIDEFYGKAADVKTQGTSGTATEDGPRVVEAVNNLFTLAISERASDVHLELFGDTVSLRYRIDGELFERTPPPREIFDAVVNRVKILSKLNVSERRLPQDGAGTLKLANMAVDYRVATCPSIYGENLVLRILDKRSVTLDIEQLGLEESQKILFSEASKRPHGLIFITGPTGSGKTTTLYSILNELRNPKVKIMTAEDPVEYRLDGITQLQVNPSIGLTFASALRSFLRNDPDVVLIGEVRDQETAESCLRAALTGHLVLSSLHTNSALEAIPRLIDLGMEPFMVASTLCLSAAQRLVRALCPACKQAYRPDPSVLQRAFAEGLVQPPADPAQGVLYKAAGCAQCSKTGFKGRLGLYELVTVTPEMANIITREKADLQKLREAAFKSGMLSIKAMGWRKVLAGLTSVEEIYAATI